MTVIAMLSHTWFINGGAGGWPLRLVTRQARAGFANRGAALMARIDLTTEIAAPPRVCFDLSRDVDFHASVGALRHRAVDGVTAGRMEVGETVTWEARQFGLLMHMTSRITSMDAPNAFTDEMQNGPFGRWRHSHEFTASPRGTVMRDMVDFASPLGPLGALVDRLYMRRHMEGVLAGLNAHLKATAEQRA